LIQLLWDPVFEISLTPNLGHCMSALGVARELSAALQIPLQQEKIELKSGKIDVKVDVQDPRLCQRYMCCLIEGVKVGPSPFWLKRAIEAGGQKSINNLVDIANYIMLKTGQPLHAFDYDLIDGKTIHVGTSKKEEVFLGLDGIERQVPAGALLISDAHKPIAIAGIMGGANSAVSEKTTRILLEGAYFDPILIRNTAKKISLRTESAQRFEKGIDIVGIEWALSAAATLMQGEIKGSVDFKKGPFSVKKIAYRVDRINQLLGTQLSASEIEEIFQRLGFVTKNASVEVPSYRNDLTEEIDLVEEVARIYGYNNIEKKAPRCTVSQIPNDPIFVFENEMRIKLAGQGLFEFLTCDLISPKLASICEAVTPASMGFLKTVYSKSDEFSILRTSLLPGLLQVVKNNLDHKNHNISAFEIGRIHFLQNEKAVEIPMMAILLTGKSNRAHWSFKQTHVDFFDLKGIIENLIEAHFVPSNHYAFHPGRQADVLMRDLTIGSLGEIHPEVLDKFGIGERVYYAEINLAHLLSLKKTQTHVSPLSQFPSSERDWTITIDPKKPIDEIFKAIHSLHSPLLERAELIDLYLPESQNKKNATFRFAYRDKIKTISFEEVETEHAKMMQHVMNVLAK